VLGQLHAATDVREPLPVESPAKGREQVALLLLDVRPDVRDQLADGGVERRLVGIQITEGVQQLLTSWCSSSASSPRAARTAPRRLGGPR
jgi:hypothetical protein